MTKAFLALAVLAILALATTARADSMKSCGWVTDTRGYDWYITANHNTSCPLARNVGRSRSLHPVVFSPVSGLYYRFDCYRSGHTYTYRRYTCVSYDGVDGPLRVVQRG